jgi:outer membrane biosynthesis protein TonB
MKMQRTETSHDELRDPLLSALLRDAYAEDPALEEAPGRTERIMRHVLAGGVRPVRSPWIAWGWATGMAAAAAVVVVLTLTMLQGPKPPRLVENHNVPAPTPQVVPAPPESPDVTPAPLPPRELVNVPQEQPRTPWQPRPDAPKTPDTPKSPAPAPAAPAPSPTVVAAALYTAGSTAHTVGDYETAYEAYSASYETVPNPQTLLAASDALLQLAAEDTASEG